MKFPKELDRLLREKEQQRKKQAVAAIKNLYRDDALVLETTRFSWLRGQAAVKFMADSTVMTRLVPNAYDMDSTLGSIAGIRVQGDGASARHVSSHL